MKKFILCAAAVLGVASMSAQEMALQQSKFTDNWSIGLKGGMVTPLKHAAFFGDARGMFGLELNKQISPVFGLGVEGEFSVNTSSWNNNFNPWAPLKSTTTIDNSYVGAYGTINMMNLFAGYKGTPRLFEVDLVAGVGWAHSYWHSPLAPTTEANDLGDGDYNSVATKIGLNLNFNLGEDKAWTVALKPAFVYNMNPAEPADYSMTYYNANACAFELQAGVTYHFKNSNGKHHFGLIQAYDQAQIDALNAQINGLRGELDQAAKALQACNARNKQLEAELTACKNRKPEVIKQVETNNELSTVRFVNFNIGKSTVSADQMPNVAAVASYLKNHPNSKVVIKGYASKDGNVDTNLRLANQRAESVKNTLINKYKIAANRIQAEGNGIGEMFEEESWNRVSICTIEEGDKK